MAVIHTHTAVAHPSPAPVLRPWLGLLGWFGVTFAAALVGGVASGNAGVFYQQLVHPDWAPPASLFGPVWTVLYILMAVAAWLVWRQRGWTGARAVLTLYLAQLVANALWTWLFFGWKGGGVAFGEILGLWSLVLLTTAGFWRVRPLAGALLLPYLAWVSFASALTYAMWTLNPVVLG